MKKMIVSLGLLTVNMLSALVLNAQVPDMTKQMEKAAKQACQDLLKETDKNKDGKISRTEFYAIWKDKKTAEEKYTFWDTNKDGYITETEYVKAVQNVGNKKK
jgi:Ca2+-binding EF-hand superfamily protein